MQNRYTGDASDFSKYLLIRTFVFQTDLKVGLNWCLVEPNKKELLKNDGKYTAYLEKEIYKIIDEELFEYLKKIVLANQRHTKHIESSNILGKDTTYFSQIIPKGTVRFSWHKESLKKFIDRDIIFYDPDNGLEVASCGKMNDKAQKYLFYDEVFRTFEKGKSIVIYQHTNRTKNIQAQIEERKKDLQNCLELGAENIQALYSGFGNSKFYLIVLQNEHKEAFSKVIEKLKEIKNIEKVFQNLP